MSKKVERKGSFKSISGDELIKIRNICNISIEEKRASKEIGSSLEADLKINLNQITN